MSQHFSADYVWLVVSSPASFQIDFAKCKSLGITGLYYDRTVTVAQLNAARAAMPRVGIFETADTTKDDPTAMAKRINDERLRLCAGDNGQTPFLLDFEPSTGSVPFWRKFLWGDPGTGAKGYRGSSGSNDGSGYMPGRVTDVTPEPFKATELPVQDFLDARMDVRVQSYYGDMSPVDAWEAGLDWVNGLNGVGYPADRVRMFVDGGRHSKPPFFYEGRVVRKLLAGTCIWSANLMREAGLI